jgi:Tfp pilus assembly protein PilX
MKILIRSSLAAQRGVVLFVTLVVLVALALGALAMFRGSLGTTLVATNVLYKQAALNLADTGVEVATTALLTRAQAGQINNDDFANGYFSAVPATDPNWSDPALWTCGVGADSICPTATQLCGGLAACVANLTGLTVYYKIHRMCTQPDTAYNGNNGAVANVCALTIPGGSATAGNSLGVGNTQFQGNPKLYFRITTRVDGPRDTRTVTQTVVAVQT